MKTRPYRMRARADAAQATGDRIVRAAYELFSGRPYDEVTLAEVARRAGVSTQTLMRRFGSKEGLADAVGAQVRSEVREQRDRAPVGDVAGAIDNLVDHYEQYGDPVLLLLAQEDRVPAYRAAAESGRRLHREWVARTFAPQLAAQPAAVRGRRQAQLAAVTDVYVWKVLRRDQRLPRDEVALALRELVAAITPGG